MQNMDLENVYGPLNFHSSLSDYYIPSWPWERGLGEGKEGLKRMDKQSDQKEPLRKKGVQSEGKEGEERGEKRQGKEGCGLEKLWSIVSPLLRHSLPFIQR